MYAQSEIDRKLHAAKIFLGWTPERHSIEEVDKFNAHYASLLEVDSKRNIYLKRDLTKTEKWWIRNERILCASDANYFKTRYCFLYNEEGKSLRYKPRKSQLVYNSIIAEFDEKQVAIELMFLKARQQGISLETQLNFGHRSLFIPGTKAVSSSVNSQKSELMSNMNRTMIEQLPVWLVPGLKKQRWSGQQALVEFHTNSAMAVQSGTQDTGIAQGWTVTCAHISEVCDYPNPVVLIDEGLFHAVHSSPAVFLVLESTGNGNVGWWPDTWKDAKAYFDLGRARLCPVFIPWHMADDLYPKEDWLKKYPMPQLWEPAKDTIAHAKKCQAYIRNTPRLARILGEDWELPRHQMWYWEFNYEEHKRKHIEKSWLQQMPADDYEALQSKNEQVFDQERIEVIGAQREKNYEVFGIVGEGIDEQHEPDVSIVDYEKPRIEIEWQTPRGTVLEWMLVPLKPFDEEDENKAMGKLLVFERPIEGCDYSMGGDLSDGVGGDRSVTGANRIGINSQPDVQACEFCSDTVSTVQAAAFMACIGAWYGQGIPNYGKPLMAIEQTRKPGDDAQNQLIRMGFTRHFKFHRLDGKRPEEDERRSNRMGWYSNAWSRPYMFGRGIDAVEGNWLKVNSPYCLKEFQQLEKRYTSEDRSRMEHQKGKHDDRVFQIFIAYVIAHTRDVMAERQKIRYSQPSGKLPELNLEYYNPFAFTVSEPNEILR